jgi:hypothetical protein
MPPGEHLDGTTAECAHLHLLLACFRASPPPMRLPEVTAASVRSPAGSRTTRTTRHRMRIRCSDLPIPGGGH